MRVSIFPSLPLQNSFLSVSHSLSPFRHHSDTGPRFIDDALSSRAIFLNWPQTLPNALIWKYHRPGSRRRPAGLPAFAQVRFQTDSSLN